MRKLLEIIRFDIGTVVYLPYHIFKTDVPDVSYSSINVIFFYLWQHTHLILPCKIPNIWIRPPTIIIDFIHSKMNIVIFEYTANLAEECFKEIVRVIPNRIEHFCGSLYVVNSFVRMPIIIVARG